jgi:hypothetical protein
MPSTKTSNKASDKIAASGRGAGNTQLEKFFTDSFKDIKTAQKTKNN